MTSRNTQPSEASKPRRVSRGSGKLSLTRPNRPPETLEEIEGKARMNTETVRSAQVAPQHRDDA